MGSVGAGASGGANVILVIWSTLVPLASAVIVATITMRSNQRIHKANGRIEAQRIELERQRNDIESQRADHSRIATLEARVDTLWEQREEDAITRRRMGDHIDVLESHIWNQLPPPPPPRPEGL